MLYDAQAGAAAPGAVSVAGNVLTIDPNAGFIGSFAILITATDTGGLSDSTLIRVDVTAAPALAGIQIPLNLGGEGEAPDAVQSTAPGSDQGTGFSQGNDGLADAGNAEYEARVDAALDAGLLDELMGRSL